MISSEPTSDQPNNCRLTPTGLTIDCVSKWRTRPWRAISSQTITTVWATARIGPSSGWLWRASPNANTQPPLMWYVIAIFKFRERSIEQGKGTLISSVFEEVKDLFLSRWVQQKLRQNYRLDDTQTSPFIGSEWANKTYQGLYLPSQEQQRVQKVKLRGKRQWVQVITHNSKGSRNGPKKSLPNHFLNCININHSETRSSSLESIQQF